MRWPSRLFAAAIAAALQACATAPVNAPPLASRSVAPVEQRAPVTILVSIDGFRPDYLTRGVTPNLNALARAGISAAMRPSFPSVTFPNHWTLVTGLRPDRHGIVGNRMEDADHPGMIFTMQSEEPFWWDAAEPLWITAEKAGIRTATMFWPGANIDFSGRRPSDWQQYGHEVSNRQRVDAVIDWLRRPAATRPRFLTLYFDVVDSAGHKYGPDDARTTAVVGEVDAAIGRLRTELAGLGQPANLVIVADHGMAPISAERVVRLDRQLPTGTFTAITDGPYAGITPLAGHETAVGAVLLKPQPHLTCWAKKNVPARLHYGQNDRVPPFICLAETGWLAATRSPPADRPPSGGAHGYDPDAPEMAALFVASGPDIAPRGALAAFDNVDVAPLIRDLLKLPADPALDGNDAPFRQALRR
ncbi:MAG: ectonucleotide pyrophosphatase/phosphodiesterase [Sphingomonas sp.]